MSKDVIVALDLSKTVKVAVREPWKMAANYRIVDATGAQLLAFTVAN
jgi:hypothetical protein